MDTQKLVLFLIFSTSMLFLWEAWQKETRPASPAEATATQPSARQNETPVPGEKLASPQQNAGVPSAGNAAPAKPGGLLESGGKIVVKTDLLTAEIDTAGGTCAGSNCWITLTRETRVSHSHYWRASTITLMWPSRG